MARAKYLPEKPRIVFVAEAPPEDIERFFYYEDVKTGDALFINLMRALYPELREGNGGTIADIRRTKAVLLKRFQNDGYYLIDALPAPISLKLSSKERIRMIQERKEAITQEVTGLLGDIGPKTPVSDTGVILIKATVFDALTDYLRRDMRFPVLNAQFKVPFPSHGHTAVFGEMLHKILSRSDRRYRSATGFVWYNGDMVVEERT